MASPGADRVLLATSNPGKVAELRALAAAHAHAQAHAAAASSRLDGVTWIGLGDLQAPLEMPEETGETFFDNALLKARAAVEQTGLPCVADDSGLEVDALGGRPGVYSARFAGPDADDAANCAKLLDQLQGVPPSARAARFRCAVVFVVPPRHPLAARWRQDGAVPPPVAEGTAERVRAFRVVTHASAGEESSLFGWTVEGTVEGRIATAARGEGGFGYDPLFYFPPLRRHFAELDMEEKNAISHRAMAFGALLRWMAAPAP